MNISAKIIIGIFLCLFTLSTTAQTTKVVRSKEQIVVAGKKYFLHTVRQKETLYSISKAYNVPSLLILHCNNKKDHNLDIGEVLKIPKDIVKTDKYIYYCLKQGETLFGVYRKTGVKIRKLLKANPALKNIKDIPVGTYVRIPRKQIKKKSFLKTFEAQKEALEKTLAAQETPVEEAKKVTETKSQEQKETEVKEEIKQEETAQETISEATPIKDVVDATYQYSLDDAEMIKNDLNIAVFLPLYLDMNDTINKVDSTLITEELPERKIYRKSENFIKFYQGVLAAIDSLKDAGYKINLYSFDTDKNKERIDSILNSIDFPAMDLIIGPPYASTFEIAARYAQSRQIPIVSPLSDKNKSIESNPYVVQLNTPQNILYSQTADYIYNRYRNANIVVVHTKDYKLSKESAITTQLEDSLFTNKDFMIADNISYKKISFDQFRFFGIKHLLNDSIQNLILVPSEDKRDINKIVPTLKALANDYKINMIGLPVWRRFTTMDPTCFFELNTTYLSPYHIDYKRAEVDAFVNKFRSMFFCEPNDFSFRAYDLSMYFIKAISKGATYNDLCNDKSGYYLQSRFRFTRKTPQGGIVNTGLFGITYDKSYNISYEIIE